MNKREAIIANLSIFTSVVKSLLSSAKHNWRFNWLRRDSKHPMQRNVGCSWGKQIQHVYFFPLCNTNTFATCICGHIILTLPLMATGRSKMPCMPRMADCGGLMMGVPNKEPNTPPLLMVKVPPSISSTASSFFRAWGVQQGFYHICNGSK